MSKRLKEKLGLSITPWYLCKMVNEVAQLSKSSIEISREFKPKWDGYIAVGDKYVRMRGKGFMSLVAVDTAGIRCTQNWSRSRTKEDLESIPEEYLAKEKLIGIGREMLNRKTTHDISVKLSAIKRRYSNKYPPVISFLSTNLEGLTAHTINHDIPKTNIVAENFNRQLQRRLKTIESFQTVSTAFNYLNLIRNYIHFKPFTDCKGKRKYRNGKSPIELCKVKLQARDLIKIF